MAKVFKKMISNLFCLQTVSYRSGDITIDSFLKPSGDRVHCNCEPGSWDIISMVQRYMYFLNYFSYNPSLNHRIVEFAIPTRTVDCWAEMYFLNELPGLVVKWPGQVVGALLTTQASSERVLSALKLLATDDNRMRMQEGAMPCFEFELCQMHY